MLNGYKKTAILAFNRSGSTLLFNIINHINEIKRKNIKSDTDKQTYKFFNSRKILDRYFYTSFKYVSGFSMLTFEKVDYFFGDKKIFLFMFNLPAKKNYKQFQIYRNYMIVNNKIIKKLKKDNTDIIFMVRHPVDLIFSNAFELENVFFRESKFYNINYLNNFKKNYGNFFINCHAWFHSMAKVAKKYYHSQIKFIEREKINYIKYEDLITDPINEIKKIALIKGILLSKAEATNIWADLKHRELTSYPNNFYKGKYLLSWAHNLDNKHIKILEQEGYDAICKKLKYPFVELKVISDDAKRDNVYLKKRKKIKSKYLRSIKKYISLRDLIFSLQFKKKIIFKEKHIFKKTINLNKEKIIAISNSKSQLSKCESLKKNPEFKRIFLN